MHEPDIATLDPILGLERIRRSVVFLSKSAFYGPAGLVHSLPVIELSVKRRGVRLSDLQRVLDARTRLPSQGPLQHQGSASRV